MDQRITTHIIALFLGALLLYWFFWPEFTTETVIEEKTVTDTVYITVKDTIRITRKEIKHETLRDTVYLGFDLPIKRFTASKPFLYGNTYVSGEVVGEVLKMDISNDFRLPQVTNTITRTEKTTIKEKPKALYLGLGVNNQLSPIGSVHYLDKQFIFSYQYQPLDKVHSIGVAKKLF